MPKETIGEYLKRERELRQISLEEVSQGTKISINRLKAIEMDRLDELPAEIFVRGFIKSYAEFIGLVPEDVLLRYQEDVSPDDQASEEVKLVDKATIRRRKEIVLILLLILAVLAGIIFWYHHHERTDKEGSRAPGTISSNTTTISPGDAASSALKEEEVLPSFADKASQASGDSQVKSEGNGSSASPGRQ